MSDIIHIQDKKPQRAMCGYTGEKTKYNPTETNCRKCFEVFAKIYPLAWQQWKTQAKEKEVA